MAQLGKILSITCESFYFFKVLFYYINKIENITYNFIPHLSQTYKYTVNFWLTRTQATGKTNK